MSEESGNPRPTRGFLFPLILISGLILITIPVAWRTVPIPFSISPNVLKTGHHEAVVNLRETIKDVTTHVHTNTTVTAPSQCPSVPAGWKATCMNLRGRMFIRNEAMNWGSYYSKKWGNALSPYWMARSLAALGGLSFSAGNGFGSDTWLKYLPAKVGKVGCVDPALFDYHCHSCPAGDWEFSHKCAGAWTTQRALIREDTHAAVQKWTEVTGTKLPVFQPDDVVVQLRCAKDTILSHGEYGPIGFSFYSNLPNPGRIFIIFSQQNTIEFCALLVDRIKRQLEKNYPTAKVEILKNGTIFEDFFRMLLAPTFMRDSQSSFGLWAAMANRGRVHAVHMLPQLPEVTDKPDLGPDWIWSEAEVLYPPKGKELGLSVERPEDIFKWLESH
ncbi:hypothetical protein CEUSTIGMA_g2988.t1 [Chlamydomonas eustigma]|uniref:Uncharacterized protein n=1 Tax=Chlamydomonas eustigma TaxID=1157962 RepID=A0A250WXN7_9CHLO|nr:hypothetical protein CEUSTIGMA_g2988.t1 [Chlamydomonas eustigma]|eukprot:GAX75545.1 hypothetical protein CEUSTIGMA_g2988.t1 [Chlamydomonas eustigma]